MTRFQIQHQNATSCTAWDESEGELVDHDYATFYDSREEAQAVLDVIKDDFAYPDELCIISVGAGSDYIITNESEIRRT